MISAARNQSFNEEKETSTGKNDLCQFQKEEFERKKQVGFVHIAQKRADRVKTTSTDKRNLHCNKLLNNLPSNIESLPLKTNEYHPLLTDADRSWIITHTQNRRRGRMSLHDYLRKNHQIFTLQYALNVKENEIEHLERDLHEQERALVQAEKFLIEDIALFDQFLETCNRNANDAALRAEEESCKKEELINDIKQLQKILLNHRNDQNHLMDTCRQYQHYQQFLFQFAPQKWREEILESNDHVEAVQTYALYFTKPEELLDIFTEMEEKSLPLVQKSQMTSESLEHIQYTINQTIIDQDHQVEQLQAKITNLEEQIQYEIDREISCQNILIEYRTSKDDPSIKQIQNAIENLYKKYLLSDDVGLSSVHMLQTIENHIKSLFDQIKHLDSTLINEAEKARAMTVRTTEYQEKIRQEMIINEIKHEKAFIRASAPPYPKLGRKLMERSRPLDTHKSRPKHSRNIQQEQWIQLLED